MQDNLPARSFIILLFFLINVKDNGSYQLTLLLQHQIGGN